jgi:hypothetical protein
MGINHSDVCLSVVSVKLVRFIAAGAIDRLSCGEVPLGQVTRQNEKLAPYDFFSGVYVVLKNALIETSVAIISRMLLARTF